MTPSYEQIWQAGEKLADAKRMQSAKVKYDAVLSLDLAPDDRALALYNTGAFYLEHLGDGIQARHFYEATVNHYEENPQLKSDFGVRKFLGWAYENLMILSLSYQEYDDWAEKLRVVSPEEGILQGQVPVIHEKQEAGMPWSDMMRMISGSYYNRNDPANDPGKYGFGAGVLQLLLENRKRLRLSREDWSTALYEYGALMQKMSMVSLRAMEVQENIDAHECKFYIDNARSRVNEYLASNQPNDVIQKLSTSTDELLDMLQADRDANSQPWQPAEPEQEYVPLPLTRGAKPFNIVSCLLTLALLGILVFTIGKIFGWW